MRRPQPLSKHLWMTHCIRYIQLAVEKEVRTEEQVSYPVVNSAAAALLLQMSKTFSKPNFQLGNQKNPQTSTLLKNIGIRLLCPWLENRNGLQKLTDAVTVFGLFRTRAASAEKLPPKHWMNILSSTLTKQKWCAFYTESICEVTVVYLCWEIQFHFKQKKTYTPLLTSINHVKYDKTYFCVTCPEKFTRKHDFWYLCIQFLPPVRVWVVVITG